MEGVPRLPMISCELKISPSNTDFGPTLKKYIKDHYHEDPESYNKEIKELESLRQSACKVPRDFTGCSTLKKYYSQLLCLQNRFPMTDEGPACVPFMWSDIYSGMVFNITDIRYEQACILYNIGALHSELGAMDNRHNAEGMKIACTHFQCSVGAFQHLRDKFAQPKGSDMSHDLLTFFIYVMQAQAQECILEKSMLDSRKASITAKVAAQVVDFYRNALKTLSAGSANLDVGCILDIVGSKLFKTWKKFLEFKESYYLSISRLYCGMQAEEQQKMGDRVAWFQSALDKLNEAVKIAKNTDRDDLGEALSYTMDVIGGKLNAAKKENDFVYHEKVPPLESLSDVQGACLVKGIEFNPSDPDVCGPDIFARLVPMEAHEASSIYSEEKAKILRSISARIEEKEQELVAYLSSLQLDQSMLSPQEEKIPEQLIEKCAALSVKPTAIADSEKVLQDLHKVCEEVDSALREASQSLANEEEQERRHQEVFGKRAPSMIVVELKKECSKYEEAHNKAKESNMNLQKALALHVENLKLLMGPLERLKKVLPSVTRIEFDPEVTQELKKLLDKVEEMRVQRQMLLSQFREGIQSDDITKKIISKGQKEDMKAFFTEELKKHDQLKSLLDQNMSAQDNILRALTQANARYADIRRAVVETTMRRDEQIAALISSYEAYEDLMSKAQKGLDFYSKLQTSVLRLLARVRSVTSVCEEEREQISNAQALKVGGRKLASSIAVPPPAVGLSGAPTPKLKDYLPYMASRGANMAATAATAASVAPVNYGQQPGDVAGVMTIGAAAASSALPTSYTPPPTVQQVKPLPNTPQDLTPVPQMPLAQRETFPSSSQQPSESAMPSALQPVMNASQASVIPSSIPQVGYPSSSGDISNSDATISQQTFSSYVSNAHLAGSNLPSQQQWQQANQISGPVPSNQYIPQQALSQPQAIPYMAPNSFTGTTYTANRYTNPQIPLSYNTSASPSTSTYQGYSQSPNSLSYHPPSSAGTTMPEKTESSAGHIQQTADPGRPVGTDGRAIYNSFSGDPYHSVTTMPNFQSSHQNTVSYSTATEASNYLQLAGQNNKLGSDYKAYYEQSNSYMNYLSHAQGFTTQSYTSTHPYSIQTYSITSTKPHNVARLSQDPSGQPASTHTPYSQSQGSYGYYQNQPTSDGSAANQTEAQYSQAQTPYSQGQQAPYVQPNASSQYYTQYPNNAPSPVQPVSHTSYAQQQNGYPQYQANYVQTQWTATSYQSSPVPPNQQQVAPVNATVPSGSVTNVANVVHPKPTSITQPSSQPVPVPTPANRLQQPNVPTNEDLLSTTPERGLNTEVQHTIVLQPKVLSSLDLQLQKDAVEMEKKRLIQKDPFSDKEALEKFVGEVEKFEKYVDSLCKKSLNGPTQLDQKWKELMDNQEKDSRKHSISVARCYPMKNRYPDIMPYDSNRVELSSVRNDYINASHIKDITPNSPRYIVTQAPLPATYVDFWAMVWEQQAEIVVCLLSNAELKSHIYWPQERGQQLTLGPVTISLQSVKEKQCYMESMISISHNETRMSRIVIHMQFSSWPGSGGNPNSPALLLQFITEVHSYYRQQRNLLRPLIVHCSGGIGRSGVFCLTSSAVVEMAAGHGLLDIVKTAALMCQQRRFLLQEKEHLKFCYEAVLYHAQDILMKRGILTNKASFEDKLLSGNPLHSHKRHPSEDFILGGLNKVQSGIEELSVSTNETTGKMAETMVDDDTPNQIAKTVASNTQTHVQDSNANLNKERPQNTAESMDNMEKSQEPMEESSATEGKSQYITSLLDPASFTLDPIASPGKRKITKESFQNPSASLMHHSSDPNDPLSQLDPLWTIHKGKN